MKAIVNFVSILSLLVTAASPVLYYADQLSETGMRTALVVAMFAWFATAWWRDRQNAAA